MLNPLPKPAASAKGSATVDGANGSKMKAQVKNRQSQVTFLKGGVRKDKG